MKKIYWTFSFLFIILVLYFITDYLRPYKLNKDISGVIYSNASTFVKNTNIHIEGEIFKSFFGRDTFNGEIVIDQDIKHEIKLVNEDNRFFGILTSDSDFGTINTIGSIMISNGFNKTWIQLDEINTRYDLVEGYVSGPANSINEANEIANSFFED